MPESLVLMLEGMAWPAAIAVAWIAGEIGARLHIPRISSYGIAGFLMAASQGGFLTTPTGGPIALLAHFAFALILFELGYRINLHWLRSNPWLGVISLAEAFGTFGLVFILAQAFDMEWVPALLLATLAMSTSPAAVLRVSNELRSSGQVTERILHLSAFNCVLAVILFKFIIGYWVLATAGNLFQAVWSSFVVVAISISIGALFGVAVPALLRMLGNISRNATIAFAIAALLLTAFTDTFQFSPLLAALTFGLVARHRRVILPQAVRNFGALGDILTVLLFVFVAASLKWQDARAGFALALAVIAGRGLVKVVATTVFARCSGITWRKGLLTGLGMTPISVFVILLLEQSRYLDQALLAQISSITAIVLLLEVIGPWVTQRALIWAGETADRKEGEA